MKIAVLTSGIRPVPAVQGGAVENLIEAYLCYNDQHTRHDITVYSVWHPQLCHITNTSHTHYRYTNVNSRWNRLRREIYRRQHGKEYYHHLVEFFFEQAYHHLRRQHFDVIIVENRPGFVIKLRQRLQTPIVLHLHNDFLNSSTRQANDISSGTTTVVCVSDYIASRVSTIDGAGTKCVTVYNAIDVTRFEQACPADRSSYGFSPDDIVVAYSGRLTEEKGVLELMRAMRQARQQDDRLKLLIIGATDYGDNARPTPYAQLLHDEAQQLGSSIVMTGFVPYNQVPRLLKMADMAVVPSLWEEPFGLTVVEAMAAGLPLITTRSGGITEVCQGVATIVDRENLEDKLASAIIQLVRHPEQRQAMSLAAKQRAQQFDNKIYAQQFFEVLERTPKR